MALELGLDRLQPYLDRFSKLPRSYRMASIPLLMALVLGGYGYFFYRPAAEERGTIEAKERELQRQVSEVRAIVANLAAFEAEIEELETALAQALSRLPDGRELPMLLTDISSLGKDSGLEFRLFRPLAEVHREFYAEVPIEVEFTGSYHDVARFFDRVARLPRIVNVGRIEMAPLRQDDTGSQLTVKGLATTFRFVDGAEGGEQQRGGQPAPRARGGRS